MMVRTGFALLVSALLVGASPVLAADKPSASDVKRDFKSTDTSGNGEIDIIEYQARMVDVFIAEDDNGDGFLEVSEVVEVEDFQAGDTNDDEKITITEYQVIRYDDFIAVDADGDGVLTEEEILTVTEISGP